MVMSHRDWIMTDRIRAGVTHQWREFFREWERGAVPGDADARLSARPQRSGYEAIHVDGKTVSYGDQGLWSSVATLTGLPRLRCRSVKVLKVCRSECKSSGHISKTAPRLLR